MVFRPRSAARVFKGTAQVDPAPYFKFREREQSILSSGLIFRWAKNIGSIPVIKRAGLVISDSFLLPESVMRSSMGTCLGNGEFNAKAERDLRLTKWCIDIEYCLWYFVYTKIWHYRSPHNNRQP